jgi:hypothetical protein
MIQTIRERAQKVFQATQQQPSPSIPAIAAATGIPKSSVQRHQQGLKRRNQYRESEWWESEAGSRWLKLLVVGSLFFFSIKHGIGVGEVSQFLKALRLERQVGCSPSALDSLKQQLIDTIGEYEAAQAEHCQPQRGQGICVGADEVFFGLPVLVLMELASGYVLTEVQCEDRSYAQWQQQIQQWWSGQGWVCHFMVSDRAKALVKLAVQGLGCASVADLFHALHRLSQPMGSALGRAQARLLKHIGTTQAQLEATPHLTKQQKLSDTLASLCAQQAAVSQAQQHYHTALQSISLSLHPFTLEQAQPQTGCDITQALIQPLSQLRQIAETYGQTQARSAIETFEQQLPELIAGVHAWWQWATQALAAQTSHLELQNWVLCCLLPWLYWSQQAEKTQHSELKQRYQQASDTAARQLLAHPFSQTLSAPERQHWIDWAAWMTLHYQRTSSAVEGRNGYLTRLHHAGRGFSPKTLKALTIIHNFHLTRPDGTTAAQRLFGYDFPDLFEWIVDHTGDLPLARQSLKAQNLKPFHLAGFPD